MASNSISPLVPVILKNWHHERQLDYMIKDHLGNVPAVLTEELKTDAYPAATMETAQATTEEALYANVNTTRADKPSGYPTDTYTNPNDKVAKVRGEGNKIGPAIILKVMAGDRFHVQAKGWWSGGTPSGTTSPLSSIVLRWPVRLLVRAVARS